MFDLCSYFNNISLFQSICKGGKWICGSQSEAEFTILNDLQYPDPPIFLEADHDQDMLIFLRISLSGYFSN